MKNKIYGKLYEFCDIRSWVKDVDKHQHVKFYSKFYKEYKLEFQNSDSGWFYKLYALDALDRYNNYDGLSHQGLVTLNKIGKFLMTLGVLLCIAGVRWLLYGHNLIIPSLPLILGFIALSILFSFFCISIFNWKLYMSLRKVQYFIDNKDKLAEKEKNEALDKAIIAIVNDTIAKNPKLARKTKLEQLNKKIK